MKKESTTVSEKIQQLADGIRKGSIVFGILIALLGFISMPNFGGNGAPLAILVAVILFAITYACGYINSILLSGFACLVEDVAKIRRSLIKEESEEQ